MKSSVNLLALVASFGVTGSYAAARDDTGVEGCLTSCGEEIHPWSFYFDDGPNHCSFCFCKKDGESVCWFNFCNEPKECPGKSCFSECGIEYPDGSIFTDDGPEWCNDCVCMDGDKACTDAFCDPDAEEAICPQDCVICIQVIPECEPDCQECFIIPQTCSECAKAVCLD